MIRTFIFVTLAATVVGGCYAGFSANRTDSGANGDDQTDGASADTEDSAGTGGDGTDGGQAACGDEPRLTAPTPMRRLTRTEYNNTIRDLLGTDARPADDFIPDERFDGYASNSLAAASTSQVRQYLVAGEALAAWATQRDLDVWLGCDSATTPCVESFLRTLGRRAYRRPLADAELGNLVDAYEVGRAELDARAGLQTAITAIVSSPNFLYLVERGEPVQGDPAIVKLSAFEIASRLSYFVWASMPDDELLSAAEDGRLSTPGEIEQQVRRMLDDGRAADTIESFHAQWLHVEDLEDIAKDTERFPAWGPELAQSMRTELARFADYVIREGDGRLETLLTAPYSFLDENLAEIYGVGAPASSFERVDLDASERAGLLTQTALLTMHASSVEPSIIHRGKLIRERMLCQTLPPPPENVDMSTVDEAGRLTDAACKGCHVMMDPIGQGFDAYDAIGALRAEHDDGAPVDPSGQVHVAGDLDGAFSGPTELGERLSASDQVHQCVVTQWLRYATRAPESLDEDDCSAVRARAAFEESGHKVPELIVAIATSDAFAYRRVTTE